jgi:hypothetical protein
MCCWEQQWNSVICSKVSNVFLHKDWLFLVSFFYLASKFSKTENNRDDDQTWLCHLVFIINGMLVL